MLCWRRKSVGGGGWEAEKRQLGRGATGRNRRKLTAPAFFTNLYVCLEIFFLDALDMTLTGYTIFCEIQKDKKTKGKKINKI